MRSDAYFTWDDIPGCTGCYHYRPLFDRGTVWPAGKVCHYLLDTGHSRGCPVSLCTKKNTGGINQERPEDLWPKRKEE